jgi:hypothetical protein
MLPPRDSKNRETVQTQKKKKKEKKKETQAEVKSC